MRFHSFTALFCLAVLAAACSNDVNGPNAGRRRPAVVSAAPAVVPMFEQFNDMNFCTGNVVTYTFTGTARIQERGDVFILVASGTVTTSDGFAGSFNRQFIFKGDQVAHLRFHDIEINAETGQRQIFSMGMYHTTAPDGTPVVGFEKYGATKCSGEPGR